MFVAHLHGHIRDEDSACLCEGRMGGGYQELLAHSGVVHEFAADEIEGPDCDEM